MPSAKPTNKQRVYDLLASEPNRELSANEIVDRLNGSRESVGDVLKILRDQDVVVRIPDTSTGKRGPHWKYRLTKGAKRPEEIRGRPRSAVPEPQH